MPLPYAEVFSERRYSSESLAPGPGGRKYAKGRIFKGMKPEDLPDACFLMDFGECSEATFAALAEKAYEKPEIRAWFPEVMAVDIRRLGERKIPETYDDL